MTAKRFKLAGARLGRLPLRRAMVVLCALTICLSLLLGAPGKPATAATFTELNPLDAAISDGTSTQSGCAFWPTTRYFLVDESFTINDLNVRINAEHGSRGQIQVTLISPAGTKQVIVASSTDTNDNYDILLDGDTGGALNDSSADTVADPVDRTVLQALLNTYEGENAHGAWLMSICDTANGTAGTIHTATALIFDGTVVTPTPLNHLQGPAQVETYYLPFPEDQMWTAMGTIYTRGRTVGGDTCSDFRSYDGDPRQPFVNYIGVTIADAGTVLSYDQWEDGYEGDLTYPTQNTTEVWGDGNLLNGVAPKDADDVLAAGQILILNDAMLTTTLQTIVDYDARDKIGATKPIAVTRSGWSDGSQTMFAAADEVYPTADWGVEYRLPVGEDFDLYEMFEYTGVSVMAAVDGTVVSIDKNADGTAEQTCTLNQGGSCQWDDGYSPVIGNGLNRGSKITSNADHPIQVSLLTGDYCAGFATRSYSLAPVADWSSSYYSPVSTDTTDGTDPDDDDPTTVHLYNPNTSVITVSYRMGNAGAVQNVTIGPGLGANVVMTDLMGAHFYSATASAGSYNARDEFASQAFNNSDGTLPWSTNWIETGDDDSPTGGSIQINGNLRFYTSNSAGQTDTIERGVNLAGATAATLSFSRANSNAEAGDIVVVEASANGGATWTQVGPNLVGNSTTAFSQSILSYASAGTRIRFRIFGRSGDTTSEYLAVDDVNIAATFPGATGALPFYAVASVDSDNAGGTSPDVTSAYDWGFTLVPEKKLTPYVIAGWAPGDDPSFLGTAAENTAPIWLTGGHPTGSATPNASYNVCIDDGGDGGPNTDALTGRTYNRTITGITPRQQVKIYYGGAQVAGQDQTGTQVWVCDGSDAIITAAWGADPTTAAPSKPGLDMGFTIRNQRTWRAVKSAALQVDLNGNALYDEGDTVRYSIITYNTSSVPVPSLTVTDTLPSYAAYVAGSTRLIDHNGVVSTIPDLGSYTYTNLPAFKSFTITFDMTINPTDPFVATRTNVAHVTDGTLTLHPEVTIAVQNPPVKLGSIGNYVWLDEDGDGDQDAGEAGIPNALVTITNGANTYTTYTDANGGYLFTDLPVGSWTVTVTPPAGLNPTYDENGIATPNVTVVTLTAGEEHLTADFGYNWSTPTETNTGGTGATGATGAIGDRVWVDVDSDGKQDPEEVGIQGVTVNLYTAGPDGLFGTADDVLAGTTSTDANGNYKFDGLAAGSYVVSLPTPPSGYTQTGDPDNFGAPCATCDHKTTDPIVLSPGDVFVNADFGYVPNGAAVGAIGDTLWVDADRGGDIDPTEPRLPGVTVALIKDTDGDGVWDAGEPIIATDVTDASGQYLFSGLPTGSTGDYLVWVNDTNNVLGDLVPTFDANGGTAPTGTIPVGSNSTAVLGLSRVQDLTTAGNLTQDFGYAPANHDAGDGLIGDTVFLDLDADGLPDAGEGLEGVLVKLYAADGVTLVASTITNENGQYFFGNLPAGTYNVQVQTGTLPYAGLTNTVDPDGGGNSLSNVVLPAGGVNLAQDFGYRDTTLPNTIGGTLWTDLNADGLLAGESGFFQGVTVVLRNAAGNIVATTTTDASGNYSFTNLPDGTYYVDVTDDANVLNGYWKSNCPSGTCGQDNNSQADPYPVTVSGGQTNTTGDFGYYVKPALVGDFIWEDLDGDGIQEAGEPGIPGVVVKLTVTYPNGETTTLSTVTGPTGYYSFGNLLLDEDFNQSNPPGGTTQPQFVVSVDTTQPALSGLQPSPQGATTDDKDSDNPAGELVTALVQGGSRLDYDFGFGRPSTIGNKVWIDENGDGLQDPGEPGIPNVTVQLWNSAHTAVIATTVTDADGGYVFKNLPAGTYQVDVLNSSLPTGLVTSTVIGGTADFTNKADPYTVTVGWAEENMTADFGYNWAPPADVNTPTSSATGAIGDRVWIDDGDGVQEPGEPGLGGVSVQLITAGPDGLFGTGDDVVAATTTTDAAGNYIFDNLAAGAYVVQVTAPANYTQTGDPDSLGILCPTCDAKTTTPIVLSPGDVFLNADFGYTPNTGIGANIGDTVFLDQDGAGPGTTGPGIPGVSVALIKDTDGDGVWDAGEPIIATDITDASGNYLFTGVPVGGNYLVLVTDTDNVLGGLAPTYDNNGVGTPNLSVVASLPASGNLNQDFGYAPPGQAANDGLIGDTIFLDRDSGGTFNMGEGLEGVTVRLYDSTGTVVLGVTTTNENGQYYFGNLPAGTYTVKVDTTTLPGGLTNTVDPDGGAASQSLVTIGGAQPLVNLGQDFGYAGAGSSSIGNQVWNDVNANGVRDDGEAGIAGVTVDLYWDSNGNGVLDAADDLVGSGLTAADGSYVFNNLANDDGGGNINYFVHVSDDANVLSGYWHSQGTPGLDDNSQADPYLVTLTPTGGHNYTADFGYYIKPAALGNRVWVDANDNGVQDGGEVGVAGQVVTLTITYPNGAVTTVQTVTDANGYYNFGNLLLDEDFNGLGSGQPTFTLSTTIPSGYVSSEPDLGGDDTLDSDGIDNLAGTLSVVVGISPNLTTVIEGLTNTDYDFGLLSNPTGTIVSGLAAAGQESVIAVTWQSLNEADLLGFNLYRASDPNGEKTLLVSLPAMKPGQFTGQSYAYDDGAVEQGVTYTYWLELVMKDGSTIMIQPPASASLLAPEPEPEPEPVEPKVKVYLPTVVR